MHLSKTKIKRVRDFVYRHGRLLERQLWAYFMGDGTRELCLRALLPYQNPDGGYGNGLEPDLLCPDSSAIGAESAMLVLDLLDFFPPGLINDLAHWIVANQNEEGVISHPPAGLGEYPHQPWWENPDDERVLVLAGYMKKWGLELPDFERRVRNFFLQRELPEEIGFYHYPHLVYLKYCGQGAEDEALLDRLLAGLPGLLEKSADHFPLFSRYWFYALDYLDRETIEREAGRFVDALEDDGGIRSPYPELPWWRPIFTLDGFILMKKVGLL